jgi:CRISPR/Cas system-associated protein Csm6
MKKVITTVGTSIFSNNLKGTDKQWVEGLKNKSASEEWDEYEQSGEVGRLRDATWKAIRKTNDPKVAAEMQSLWAISERLNQPIQVAFWASDTILSCLAAELLVAWIKTHLSEEEVSIIQDRKYEKKGYFLIEGLFVYNNKKFQSEGLNSLVNEAMDLINSYHYDYCAFNITGGHKGTIPYMTILGQLNKVPIYYQFEDAGDLISIPQAPIEIDWTIIGRHSAYFDKYSTDLIQDSTEWNNEKKSIPDLMLNFLEQEEETETNEVYIYLNPIGKIAWEAFKRYFFVKIPFNCRLFKENPTDKKSVEKALQILEKKLAHITNFGELHDDQIKHCPIENTWVYKHRNPQIRIQYDWDEEKRNLTLFNYVFIRSEIDDKDPKRGYRPTMEREYGAFKNLSENDFRTYSFLKLNDQK